MDIQRVLDFLQQKWSDYDRYEVCNIYLFGSRLHGTSDESSDYDFIVLVDGEFFPGPILHEEGILNTNVYHCSYWQMMLDQNVIWCMFFNWIPEEFVYMKKMYFSFTVKKFNLKKSVLMDTSHNYSKAKRSWKEGTIRKAKKNLIHAIRWVSYAIQVLKFGELNDINFGNEEWIWLMENESDDWMVYESRIRPIQKVLVDELNALVEPLFVDFSNPPKDRLFVIDYIKDHGLESLDKELSISVVRHKEYPSLIQLIPDSINSPSTNQIVLECNMLILDESDNWKIICQGYPKFFQYTNHRNIAAVDWENIDIYELVDGEITILYYYGEKWHFATKASPDGTNSILTYLDGENYYYHSPQSAYNAWSFFADSFDRMNEQSPFYGEEGYYPNVQFDFGIDYVKKELIFNEEILNIWSSLDYKYPTHTNQIYLFELCSEKIKLSISRGRLYDAISEMERTVVMTPPPPNTDILVLHGIRDMNTLHEISISLCDQYEKVQTFNDQWMLESEFPKSKTKLIKEYMFYINPLICRGVVVVDKDFNRQKFESEQFRSIQKLCWSPESEKTSRKEMLKLLISGDCQVYLERFPQFVKLYEKTKNELDNFLSFVEEKFDKMKQLPIQEFKTMAQQISVLKPTFFAYRNYNVQNQEMARKYFFHHLPFKHFLRLITDVGTIMANENQ